MIAYYGSTISKHMTQTPEGFLICRDVPIARIGTQDYLARELGLDGEPDRPVTVERRPEDVFDPAAIASFEGKDVTYTHPPEMLAPENQSSYSKGHAENVRREGDFLVADLHLKDPTLISEVRNGILREVSCGYLCDYTPSGAGYRQTNIRGNHIAIVPRGRAGHDVAIKMARYKIYDNKSDVITPVGEKLTAEQWLDRYQSGRYTKMIVGGGIINGSVALVFDDEVERYRKAGCDFSACVTDEDYLAAIEAFEDDPPMADAGVSDQTRIADALEDMVALSLPDDTTNTTEE